MTKLFETTYRALQAPETARACAIAVGRATRVMAESRYVKEADAAIFFKSSDCCFVVSSNSQRALEELPLSYGSVVGHFGEFERGDVVAVPAAENFQAVYAISSKFVSFTRETRLRLAREVGGRLATYLAAPASACAPVRVSVNENRDTISVCAASIEDLAGLPSRFNAVFLRGAVSAL